jgi:hypothetical protein
VLLFIAYLDFAKNLLNVETLTSFVTGKKSALLKLTINGAHSIKKMLYLSENWMCQLQLTVLNV